MEKLIIDCKETEYLSRYYLAAHTGKQEKARKLVLATLVMLRQQSRIAHMKAESLWSEARGLKRSMKKMSEAALKFPLGELRVKKLESDANAAQKELAQVGEEIHQMLELTRIRREQYQINRGSNQTAKRGEKLGCRTGADEQTL